MYLYAHVWILVYFMLFVHLAASENNEDYSW